MPEVTEPDVPVAATPLGEIARGVGWLVGTAAAVRLVETLIGRSPLGAALAGAVIVDLAMTRAGVRWDSRDQRASKKSTQWRELGIGAGVACALVAGPVLVSVVIGGATVAVGNISSVLVFGLLRGVANGVRDEFLYRGLPLLVAQRVGIRPFWAIGYAGLLGVAPLLFAERLSWEALMVFACQGVLLAMLWIRTNAAWASVSAHAVWFFLAGAGLRGSVLDVSWTNGMLAESTSIRGLPAFSCVVVSILLIGLVSKKLVNPSEAPHGQVAS